MKLKKRKLETLRIKSFITTMEANESFTIVGAGTEDDTNLRGSLQFCKLHTIDQSEVGSDAFVCITNNNSHTD